ncbi:MAG: F0F1 ATP synthase subunit B [Flavobacteriales bacterium]|jgi:F-type H+-transporting ATPase subunit b|uniref:F0F1 ATP synthase subunit B n=1 Tax=Blattabacterium sp. (Mastotermes darwiniensis) TaxID=39768 RepID=UPI000231DE1A|nr:F0F1 ATP synthase subunit B [Blattabacterium sp. (Mastotermes darwiniensis)]AER40590.1 ATP synthase subunit B [Blattabacterium sp. (Mastotermes darwiniensis) str. MADAR]MDR1805087.1 F0F1 ATP synthase subunit B [Flavobacteriales bacterium]
MDLVTPSIGLIVWQTIIFLILMFFLTKYAWKPIIKFIDKREEKIRISIEKADQVQRKLDSVENEKNKILKDARIKRDMILKEAIQIKENIKHKSMEEGFLEKKKILEETKKIIQIERKTAIQDLKNQIGDISIKIAEKILMKEFDKHPKMDKQEKFIKELLNNKFH